MEVTDFDAERPRLTAIATRILGSEADADDVLQEAWLRLSRTDAVDDLPAWLTTVVTRLCLDQLRKRRTRSVVEAAVPDDHVPVDPEADTLLAEMTGDAMQVVLDALAPAERAAFVLHDVFGYPFDEVSAVMGRSGTAVRQLASRARRKVQGVPEPVASQVRTRREPAGRRRLPHRSPRWGPSHLVVAARARRRHACRPGWADDGRGTHLSGGRAPLLLASTAPGGRRRSPSMASWVPLGSKPDRPRWHSSSISTRRAWCTRSS